MTPCATCGGTFEHVEQPPCPAILPEEQRAEAATVWLVLRLFGIIDHTSDCRRCTGGGTTSPCTCRRGPVIASAKAWLEQRGAL